MLNGRMMHSSTSTVFPISAPHLSQSELLMKPSRRQKCSGNILARDVRLPGEKSIGKSSCRFSMPDTSFSTVMRLVILRVYHGREARE